MKKTYQIEGMRCQSCAILIEGELEDIGVSAKVNYPKQTLEVEHAVEVKENEIAQAVAKAGYKISKF